MIKMTMMSRMIRFMPEPYPPSHQQAEEPRHEHGQGDPEDDGHDPNAFPS
jgi:hypothetical protein